MGNPQPLTGSSAPGIEKCISRGLFHAVRTSGAAADEGSAIHEHLFQRAVLGVDEALLRLPEVLSKWNVGERESAIIAAQMRKFAWSPPRGAIGEVALLIAQDGSVRRTVGGRGQYPAAHDRLLPLTLDLAWSEPEPLLWPEGLSGAPRVPEGSVLHVVDIKTGSDVWVDPAANNLQLLAEAYAMARWANASEVAPMILYPRGEKGIWDAPPNLLGPEDLRRTLARLLALKRARDEAIGAYANGGLPVLHEGPWCMGCESADACPAKLQLVKAALDAPEPEAPGPLSQEQRVRLVSMKDAAERFARKAKAVLQRSVDAGGDGGGPIDMGGGVWWGPVVESRQKIQAEDALDILFAELGDFAHVALDISKSGIERAIAEKHEQEGISRQKAPAMRRILAKLHEEGAIVDSARVEYKLHRLVDAEGPKDDLEGALRASLSAPIEEGR